jgi:heme-degrading monooxygenase HmoA
MIARTWRGATKAEDAEAYLDYLNRTGFAEYRRTPGNHSALGLRRIVGDRAEFLLLSLWESEEAIRRFAGDDIEKAVFYPEDEQYLVDRDLNVSHYEVVFDSASLVTG